MIITFSSQVKNRQKSISWRKQMTCCKTFSQTTLVHKCTLQCSTCSANSALVVFSIRIESPSCAQKSPLTTSQWNKKSERVKKPYQIEGGGSGINFQPFPNDENTFCIKCRHQLLWVRQWPISTNRQFHPERDDFACGAFRNQAWPSIVSELVKLRESYTYGEEVP